MWSGAMNLTSRRRRSCHDCTLWRSHRGARYGHPFTARDLARLLRPYRIKSKTARHGESTPKGYLRADLEDAWSRYTRTPATSATAQQAPAIPEMTSENGRFGSVADSESVSATVPDPQESPDVADVADVAEVRLDDDPDAYDWSEELGLA